MDLGICGENLIWAFDNGSLTIGGIGEMNDFSYPKETPWNAYKKSIEKITINVGVTTIGDAAFIWCCNLRKIIIPASVTTIGDNAFAWCTYLTEIKIPESVKAIGSCAFYDCKSLREIEIPHSVKTIGGGVFAFCPRLEEIFYPSRSSFEGTLGAGNNAELIPCKKLLWKILNGKIRIVN